MTPGQRHQVVDFANRHGVTAAARRFGVPKGTVASWQHRARALERRRQAQAEADRELAQARARELVAKPDPDEAELARRMREGRCLRCGGVGRVAIPAVTRGSLILRRARRMACPDCGGVPRIVQVVEHPREDWTQAQAVAGDLGAGWSPSEWARIRAGDVDPDGYRYSGRPDA